VVQQAFNAVVLSSIYAIVALGFTLYFGTMNLVNFAHGDCCTLAAFLALLALPACSAVFGRESWVALGIAGLVAVLATIFLAALSERWLFRRLRGRAPLEGLIVSLGLAMLIREAILHFYPNGGNPQGFPDPFHNRSAEVLGVSVSVIQVMTVASALFAALAFYWVVQRTRFGRLMRALSQDPEAAQMVGLPVDLTILGSFALGGACAGVGGILSGALYGSIRFDMGISLGLKGFVCAVIGGLDNPAGAFLGAIILAGLETAIVGAAPGGSAYRDVAAYTVLLFLMIFRPTGLLSAIKVHA